MGRLKSPQSPRFRRAWPIFLNKPPVFAFLRSYNFQFDLRFGRRKASTIFLVTGIMFSLLFVILHLAKVEIGGVMTALALVSVWSVSCEWTSIAMFNVELFPTVIRFVFKFNYNFISLAANWRGSILARTNKTLFEQLKVLKDFSIQFWQKK